MITKEYEGEVFNILASNNTYEDKANDLVNYLRDAGRTSALPEKFAIVAVVYFRFNGLEGRKLSGDERNSINHLTEKVKQKDIGRISEISETLEHNIRKEIKKGLKPANDLKTFCKQLGIEQPNLGADAHSSSAPAAVPPASPAPHAAATATAWSITETQDDGTVIHHSSAMQQALFAEAQARRDNPAPTSSTTRETRSGSTSSTSSTSSSELTNPGSWRQQPGTSPAAIGGAYISSALGNGVVPHDSQPADITDSDAEIARTLNHEAEGQVWGLQ